MRRHLNPRIIISVIILVIVSFAIYFLLSNNIKIYFIQSDLANNAKTLKLYFKSYGSYPTELSTSFCPVAPIADNNYCLKNTGSNILNYSIGIISSDFRLTSTNGLNSYAINSSAGPAVITTTTGSSIGLACPLGYIPVPGSGTYDTNDFCIMKYEAKIKGVYNGNQTYDSAFVPESRASGTPWVNISQSDAMAEAATACAGCHLITEAEWMTIAQNVLSVKSNWSSGVVGVGYIYSGHNRWTPNASLSADADDNKGYAGETDADGSNQKRTLTLTNNQVIWDLAGNVWEWTAGQTTGKEPDIVSDRPVKIEDYADILDRGDLAIDIFPSGTGLAGAWAWTADENGIGRIVEPNFDGFTGRNSQSGYKRGGNWGNGLNSGVLSISYATSSLPGDDSTGWRVTSQGL